MEQAAYIEAIRSSGAALSKAAEGALDTKIESCPGWVMADLVSHLGGVYSWANSIVNAEGERPDGGRSEPPIWQDDLIPWFDQNRAEVVAALGSRRPEDPAWVFIRSAPQNVGWWCRRQALETAVHRFDAESAIGSPTAVEAALAADGVDEFLTQFLPGLLARSPVEALTGTFHVHASDTPGEWSLDFAATGLVTRREHSKADTAVRGPASGLFLWVWNRISPEEAGIEVFGNRSTVDAWRDIRM